MAGNGNGNDIKGKVKALYEIMKDEKIQELEVNSKDYTLFIKRKDPNEGETRFVVKKQAAAQIKNESAAPASEKQNDKETIKSPITGIFYQSPSPSSPAFVNVGDVVEIGKPLCIIEAMKVMNEIKAAAKAKIVKIVAENGKPVNSGQDLFEIENI
jgi:acetyl-CoA carboxylase biotin carboxyl carrier protein